MNENEIEAFTVAVGNIDPFNKYSRAAVNYIMKLDGFIGFNPCPPRGTLLLFETENAAKIARNKLNGEGVATGKNICKCFVDKKYLKGREKK